MDEPILSLEEATKRFKPQMDKLKESIKCSGLSYSGEYPFSSIWCNIKNIPQDPQFCIQKCLGNQKLNSLEKFF